MERKPVAIDKISSAGATGIMIGLLVGILVTIAYQKEKANKVLDHCYKIAIEDNANHLKLYDAANQLAIKETQEAHAWRAAYYSLSDGTINYRSPLSDRENYRMNILLWHRSAMEAYYKELEKKDGTTQ